MIYQADKKDIDTLSKLAVQMWNNSTILELKNEFTDIMNNKESAFFILSLNDKAIGFAQCQLRFDYVEGTSTSPVGYLEGIFIQEDYRQKGYAKDLLKKCEQWAKAKGCTEFASDCELNNHSSLNFHLQMGFNEVNRIICFTKKIN